MYLALLLIVPLLLCLLMGYVLDRMCWDRYSLAQFLITIGICLVIAGGGLALEFYGVTTDTEVWSGSITGKQRNEVSCRHSYPCNCHEVCTTDSEGHEECNEHCDTCYEHSYDVDWDLYFSTGKEMSIATVDRQGLTMPDRWAKAYQGEPTAEAHRFTNYLLAAPDNVMLRRDAAPGFSGLVPPYPSSIYDYYRCDRFLLGGGVPVQGLKDWEWLLDRINADLGSVKQVNIIMILAYTADPRYEFALQKAWVGGKKNDLIVVIGTTRYPEIDWCRIVSWTTDEGIKVVLRDDIMAIGTLDRRDDIMNSIRSEVSTRFKRRRMRDLKYLVASHAPSGATLGIILLLECLSVFGVVIAFRHVKNQGYERRDRY